VLQWEESALDLISHYPYEMKTHPKLCLAQREVVLTHDSPEQGPSGLSIPQTLHTYVVLQPGKELYVTGACPDVELGCHLGMGTTDSWFLVWSCKVLARKPFRCFSNGGNLLHFFFSREKMAVHFPFIIKVKRIPLLSHSYTLLVMVAMRENISL